MYKLARIKGAWPYLIAIFLNAFIELGHKVILQNSIFKAYDGQQQVMLMALMNGLILLPFILLITPVGFMSDKHPRNKVMRVSAWAALAITAGIVVCYYQGLFALAFVMTFLLAVQSAFYSPSKYGYIKSLFGKEKLAQSNALVQSVSIAAILASMVLFTSLFESLYVADSTSAAQILQLMAPLSWLLVANAIFELVMAYRLPNLQTSTVEKAFDWREYRTARYFKASLSPLLTRRIIRLSIIGLAMFWSIGHLLMASFPAYAKANFAITNTLVIQAIMIASGVGIALGSWIAGRWSKNHIEMGLIPIGAIGLAIALWFLPFMESSFLQALCFFFTGMMGGIFIVPLNALIQFHSTDDELGKMLALNNWVQNVCMMCVLLLTAGLAYCGINSALLLIFTAAFAMIIGLYTISQFPQSLVHIVLNWSISRRYKISVQGMQHIPAKGGVLLLGNHVSWMDWAVLQIACPRPVRFVMEERLFSRWYVGWFLKMLGCIPIDTSAASKESMLQIAKKLDKGEVLALFPEGAMSRNGHLGEFKKDFELACSNTKHPLVIVPFYMRGLWGSKFSYSSNNLKEVRRRALFRDLVIAFGENMPKQSNAEQIKRCVFDLSVKSWNSHAQDLQSLGNAWIDTVKRVGKQRAITDNTGKILTAQRTLVGAISLSKIIKKANKEQNVGQLLPTSAGGVITNMATILAGKTIVNLNYTASHEALVDAIAQAKLTKVYSSKLFLQRLKQRGIDLTPTLAGVEVIYLEDVMKEVKKTQQIMRLLMVKLLPADILKTLYVSHVDNEQVAAILFSSGSEGSPKGVMLSHTNVMANLQQVSDVLNTQETDVIMGSLPLFHAFGLTVTQFLPLIEGIPLVCHADPTDAEGIGQAVAKHNVTIICGTSTFFRLYSNSKKLNPLMFNSLRFVVAGAEKLNLQVKNAFESKFNKSILEGYGTTETTPVASVNLPDTLDKKTWQVQVGGKEGTVGMPLPGTSFKIVDPDTFAELPTGEAGLVLIGGAQIMLGYLNNPEKTEQVIKEINGERWYLSGDKGKLDSDGFLTILDRYSRFAKLGGEMISLSAIELAALKDLDDEIEGVAVALDDPQKGESIVFLYQGELDSRTVRKSMLAQGCNPLMVPKRWYQVEAIPKLGAGKTDFSKSKQLALQMVNAS